MKAATALAAASLMACGGVIQGEPDAGDAAGDGVADAAVGDGGWTACEAPSGVSICGGPNDCGAHCKNCSRQDAGDLNVCNDTPYYFDAGAGKVTDGYICPDGALNACDDDVLDPNGCWQNECTTADLPKLWLLNGRPDLARYADRSTYTGDPIPSLPTSCPSVAAGLELCGGACGPCQDGTMTCTGRSPLHPYSMCLTSEPESFPCARGGSGYCNSVRPGDMCLTYQVDSAAQSIADGNSLCVPSSICQAAAQSYPGGAFCTAGNVN